MTGGPARSEVTLRVWTRSILIAIVVWLVLRTFVVEAVRIPSGSMEGTLLVGDFLFVRKAFYTPHRGDLVVFQSVEEPGRKLVKRVIGLPGDTLAMRGRHGDPERPRGGRAVRGRRRSRAVGDAGESGPDAALATAGICGR